MTANRTIELLGALVASGALVAGLWGVSSEYSKQTGRIEHLEEQVHAFESKVNASTLDIADLKDRLRNLESKTVNTASTLAELSKKPTAAVNPTQQKCIELADQVNTGNMVDALHSDAHDPQKAAATMKELGCASMGR